MRISPPLVVAFSLSAYCWLVEIVDGGAPPWQCRVCEDVAQTWHDAFPCSGGYVNWGSPIDPNIKGCLFPQFDCNKLNGQLKAACFAMIAQFEAEPVLQRKMWMSMMLHNDAYKTCITLGKCEDESTMPGPTQCHEAFLDPYCKHNWRCVNYTRQCDEVCYLCNWLVRDWPLFQEDCRPDGAKLPQSVPHPDDIWPSGSSLFPQSFLQLEHHEQQEVASKQRHSMRLQRALRFKSEQQQRIRRLLRMRSAVNDTATTTTTNILAQRLRERHLGSRVLAASATVSRSVHEQQTAAGKLKGKGDQKKVRLMTGFTRTEECFKIWNLFRTTAKGRYFGSWKKYVNVMPNQLDRLKGTMWDANIACKCMGRCELNRFEALGLYEACRYDEDEQRAMRIIYRNNGDIAVTEI